MYFNRKNAEQKNWRMIKKGKHFLFGCSLVFAVGATLATPAVHADSVEAKAETTTSAAQAEPTAEAPTLQLAQLRLNQWMQLLNQRKFQLIKLN